MPEEKEGLVNAKCVLNLTYSYYRFATYIMITKTYSKNINIL